MKRAASVLLFCLCFFQSPPELAAASSASAGARAGDCEGGGNSDSDFSSSFAQASTSDTDPQYGTASADATTDSYALQASGDAVVFAVTAWCTGGDADYQDSLDFLFPVDSITGSPEDLQVELTAELNWSISATGTFDVSMQGLNSNYSTESGFFFNDFDLPATDSGSATLIVSGSFDFVELDPENPEFYRAEFSLGMSLSGNANAVDPLLGGTPSGSFDHSLLLTGVRLINGTEEIDAEIEADSGEGYEFEILTADFDDDGDVDGRDFLLWQRGYGIETGAELIDGDSNADGIVDDFDLEVWQDQYAEPGHISALASVPEPTSATMICCAALFVLSTHKRWS